MPSKNCKVCLIEHDEEIHAATLRLREWLRQRLVERIPELAPSQDDAASAA